MQKKIEDKYRRYLESVRDCAPRTIDTYLGEIKAFAKTRELLTATPHDVLAYRESMNRKPSGVRLAMQSLRYFYDWAVKKGLLNENPVPDDLRIKVKRQDPVGVPTAAQFMEIRRRLQRPIPDKRAVPLETRRLIVELLAGSGLRVEAALTLRRQHLRLGDRPHIMVEAGTMSCKGRHAGEVPISPYLAGLLVEYMETNKVEPGRPLIDVSESVVRKILHEVAPEGMNLKPHSLRHFYCSMLYFRNFDGGEKDIVWVKEAAGHESITTTDRYLAMARRVCQDVAHWRAWAEGSALSSEAAA